jgi:hypothetical protein
LEPLFPWRRTITVVIGIVGLIGRGATRVAFAKGFLYAAKLIVAVTRSNRRIASARSKKKAIPATKPE